MKNETIHYTYRNTRKQKWPHNYQARWTLKEKKVPRERKEHFIKIKGTTSQ